MAAKTKTITVQVDERLAAEIDGTTVHDWRTTTSRQLGPTLRPRSGSPPGWSARLSALLRTTLRRTLKRVRRRVEESTAESVPSCDRLTLDKFEEGLWRGSGSGIRWL